MEVHVFEIFGLSNKIYSNHNSTLLEIVNDLNQLTNFYKDDLVSLTLNNVIIKIKNIINENKKNTKLIRNSITRLYYQINKKSKEFQINANKNQELIYESGRYIGQVLNGKREGKGIYYLYNGERYDGDWKNDKKEGKGIYYFSEGYIYKGDFKNDYCEGKGVEYYSNGDLYEGDFRKDKREGKGIYYYNNGDRYEGDWRNDLREGKGVMYYINGDREMGNYFDDNKIGKHALIEKNGEVFFYIY